MPALLTNLRHRTPQLTPGQFLAQHPGSFIQFYDDTPRKDPAKALSMPTFDVVIARRKQLDRCAVCFSLQAFGAARTKEEIVSFRTLGVDIDLIRGSERHTLPPTEIDERKDEYLRRVLLPFPLKPHWLIETRHGFHVLFRVRPLQDAQGINDALAVNRRLVSVLRGDENAVLLTQVLRVPGTFQFKHPQPFLCRLLLDNSRTLEPYPLAVVRNTLDAWEVLHGERKGEPRKAETSGSIAAGARRDWQAGLAGVSEGQRNATAAAIVGGILGRLPEYLWETAGWGGLKEWNGRNAVPLPERELRSVFLSIARRERAKRGWEQERSPALQVRVTLSIEKRTAPPSMRDEPGSGGSSPVPHRPR